MDARERARDILRNYELAELEEAIADALEHAEMTGVFQRGEAMLEAYVEPLQRFGNVWLRMSRVSAVRCSDNGATYVHMDNLDLFSIGGEAASGLAAYLESGHE